MKSDPFYDEFVEKQLLAGNIPCRQFAITLLSVSASLPMADHGKPAPNQTELTSAQPKAKEQPRAKELSSQPGILAQVSRIDIDFTATMYPTELTKLTLANVEYPAGQMMLQQAYSQMSLKVPVTALVCLRSLGFT